MYQISFQKAKVMRGSGLESERMVQSSWLSPLCTSEEVHPSFFLLTHDDHLQLQLPEYNLCSPFSMDVYLNSPTFFCHLPTSYFSTSSAINLRIYLRRDEGLAP
jgi:hypothetical protein